jgi:putative NIF3 family GTP cyclohydrolase 1 type 2
MNWFPAYKKMFRVPSAETLAAQELEEAKRQLLAAHTALDYAQSMVEYRTRQIERLKTMLVVEGTK